MKIVRKQSNSHRDYSPLELLFNIPHPYTYSVSDDGHSYSIHEAFLIFFIFLLLILYRYNLKSTKNKIRKREKNYLTSSYHNHIGIFISILIIPINVKQLKR